MTLNSPSPRNSRREFRGVNPRFTSPVGVPTAPDRRSHAFRGTGNVYRPTPIPPARGHLPPRRMPPVPGAMGQLLKVGTFLTQMGTRKVPNGVTFPVMTPKPDAVWHCSTPPPTDGPRPIYSSIYRIPGTCGSAVNSNKNPWIEWLRTPVYKPPAGTKHMSWWVSYPHPSVSNVWKNQPNLYIQWDDPPYPGAWPAPMVAGEVGVVVAPPPVARSYPEPQPLAAARIPRNPIIRPGLGFEFTPGRPPRVIRVPRSRPPARAVEGKANGKAAAALSMVVDAFNSTTEVADVLAIFWDNLPRPENAPFLSFWDHMVWMMANPERWEEVDWDKMIADLIANEVEDQIIGRAHGLKERLRTEWGEPIYGGAFQGP